MGRLFFYRLFLMRLKRNVNNLYDAALAVLYPQACTVCGASVEARDGGVACEKCWRATRIFNGSETLCWKCGALMRGSVPEEKREEVRCRLCDEAEFDAARACGVYEKALRAVVLALKREPYVAPRLARVMCEAQCRVPLERATLVVPVPLHPERERERGFNQAVLLGRALSKLSGLRFDEWSLVRISHTERHRAGMDARSRRESVEEAFEVARPRLVKDESILLVDDVFTTGATVSSCAKALKQAGAREVFVLTVARPLRDV